MSINHFWAFAVFAMNFLFEKVPKIANGYLTSVAGDYLMYRKIDFTIHEFSQLNAIISFYSLIMKQIIPAKDDDDSKFIFNLIEILFYRHIWDHIHGLSQKVLKELKENNQDVFYLFKKIRDIEIELGKYKDIWPN